MRLEVDPEYPGTAVERLRNIQSRVKSLSSKVRMHGRLAVQHPPKPMSCDREDRQHRYSRTVRDEIYMVCAICLDVHPKQLKRAASLFRSRTVCVKRNRA
eukprot:6430281-Amphidinium_carterae.1